MNKTVEALVETIGVENLEILAGMCSRIKERAIDRQSDQTIELVFNTKGYLRHINGSDNVNGVAPKKYQPE
jgi:hypothetical protein